MADTNAFATVNSGDIPESVSPASPNSSQDNLKPSPKQTIYPRPHTPGYITPAAPVYRVRKVSDSQPPVPTHPQYGLKPPPAAPSPPRYAARPPQPPIVYPPRYTPNASPPPDAAPRPRSVAVPQPPVSYQPPYASNASAPASGVNAVAGAWKPPVTPTMPTPGAPKHTPLRELSGAYSEPGSFADAILRGTPWIDVRYRYEDVSQDGIHRHAKASTIRSRLGYESGLYDDFKVGFEVQNLRDIGAEHFNNGINGKTLYPTVGDPEVTELRQGYVAYDGIPDTEIKLGRQIINLDDVRFVGSPDWRQLNQDFDAATFYSTYFNRATLFYGYVRQVNRNGGPDLPELGTYIGNTQLFNASYEFMPVLKVTGFTYLLDFQSSVASVRASSGATFGMRFTGTYPAGDGVTLSYTAQGAHQDSYTDNPAGISENYYLLEPVASGYGFTGKLGYEMLEGNGVTAFQTPLDAAHNFDGWADKFVTTPSGGLLDKYASLSYNMPFGDEWIKGTSLTGVYRQFNSDAGDIDYGHEWDGLLEHTFFGHYTTSLEVADYRADHLFTDTLKTMAFVTAKY